jgi:hypothetical protein
VPPGCVPQPYRLIVYYPMLWTFPLAPPGTDTSTTTRETSSRERGNYGREMTGSYVDNDEFHAIVGINYMPQICDMRPTALLPLRRRACLGFFSELCWLLYKQRQNLFVTITTNFSRRDFRLQPRNKLVRSLFWDVTQCIFVVSEFIDNLFV